VPVRLPLRAPQARHNGRLVSASDAERFLRELLDGRALGGALRPGAPPPPFFHVAPQAGVLRGLASLGRGAVRFGVLERSAREWARLFRHTPLNGSALSACAAKGCHGTSADPQGAKTSMVAAPASGWTSTRPRPTARVTPAPPAAPGNARGRGSLVPRAHG